VGRFGHSRIVAKSAPNLTMKPRTEHVIRVEINEFSHGHHKVRVHSLLRGSAECAEPVLIEGVENDFN
jgi:formaldehyde-activating enzyme involved in methanogenesis